MANKKRISEIVITERDFIDRSDNSHTRKFSSENVTQFGDYTIGGKNNEAGYEDVISLIRSRKSGWITTLDYMKEYNETQLYAKRRLVYAKQVGIITVIGTIPVYNKKYSRGRMYFKKWSLSKKKL